MKNIYFICAECAEEVGGVWPKDHVATMHEGKCDMCGVLTGLASVADYDYFLGIPNNFIGDRD